VGGGDATPHILLPCVREGVPRTDIEGCGDIQNWCCCCRKEKTLLLLKGTAPQFLEEEVNWMVIQSIKVNKFIMSMKYRKFHNVLRDYKH